MKNLDSFENHSDKNSKSEKKQFKIIKLDDEHIKTLENLPEQGIGYQIVDITLKNGQVFKQKFVLNSTNLRVDANDTIDVNNIDKIEISKL